MPIELLPARLRPALRRFRDWFATDKGVVLLMAAYFTSRLVSYFVPLESGLIQHFFELRWWWIGPCLWGVSALLLWVAVFTSRLKVEVVALCSAAGMLMLWGVLFGWSIPPGFFDRGTTFIALAAMTVYTVWRGHFGVVVVRREEVVASDRGPAKHKRD